MELALQTPASGLVACNRAGMRLVRRLDCARERSADRDVVDANDRFGCRRVSAYTLRRVWLLSARRRATTSDFPTRHCGAYVISRLYGRPSENRIGMTIVPSMRGCRRRR